MCTLADPVELREYETSPDHVPSRSRFTARLPYKSLSRSTHQAVEGEQPSDSSHCRLNRMETMLKEMTTPLRPLRKSSLIAVMTKQYQSLCGG